MKRAVARTVLRAALWKGGHEDGDHEEACIESTHWEQAPASRELERNNLGYRLVILDSFSDSVSYCFGRLFVSGMNAIEKIGVDERR